MNLKGIPIITLWQPWAQWVALGWKSVETRTHNRFKGLVGKDILIHAGMSLDSHAYDAAKNFLAHEKMAQTFNQDGDYSDFRNDKVSGKIIAKAHVAHFRELYAETVDESFALIECATNRWGLFLTNIQPLDPFVPAQGKQGIWYL
jgi:hypothetical protein